MPNILAKITTGLKKIPNNNVDEEILRLAIMIELDAICLYERLAILAEDEETKKIFRNVIQEEKTHIGEFKNMLYNMGKRRKN